MNYKQILITAAIGSIAFITSADNTDYTLYNRITTLWNTPGRGTNSEIKAEVDRITDDEWLEFAKQTIETNRVLSEAQPNRNVDFTDKYFGFQYRIFEISRKRFGDNRLCDYYDDEMSSVGAFRYDIYDTGACWYRKMLLNFTTKIQTNFFNRCPVLARRYERRLAAGPGDDGWYAIPCSIAERMNIFEERASLCWVAVMDTEISRIINASLKPIKYKLRQDGKSFVVRPDGKNPVQEYVNRIIKCTEAPKCQGLKEIALELDPNYQWIDTKWKTDDEIKKLSNAIFYGDEMFSDKNKRILRFHLGLEEYNAFVERYNGSGE